MSVVYRQGFWTDVCVLPDGRFAQVATDGATERVFISGERDTELPAAEPLMFCRCACGAHDGVVYSIHQGHDTGSALLITHTGVQNLGPTFGVQPVAIDSQYAYVVRSNQAYDRIRLDNGAVEHLPHGAPGSSQGISDVVDGEIWWADLERLLTVAGVALTYPNELVGAVIVGQTDPPQIAGAFTSKRKWQPFTAIPGPAFEPHLAQSGERYAIVARTPQGAAYVEVPPYPALLTTSAPPIVNIPKPEEPKPVSIPNQLSIVQRVRAKYPTPLGQQHPAFLIDVAQQTGAKLLRKDGGTHVTLPNGVNVSQDILMFGTQGVDILSDGEGAATPAWGEKGVINGEYIDVHQFSLPSEGGSQPGTSFPPVPAPAPAQPDPATLTAIVQGLGDLRTLLDAMQQQLGIVVPTLVQFAARPAPRYEGTVKFSGAVKLEPKA